MKKRVDISCIKLIATDNEVDMVVKLKGLFSKDILKEKYITFNHRCMELSFINSLTYDEYTTGEIGEVEVILEYVKDSKPTNLTIRDVQYDEIKMFQSLNEEGGVDMLYRLYPRTSYVRYDRYIHTKEPVTLENMEDIDIDSVEVKEPKIFMRKASGFRRYKHRICKGLKISSKYDFKKFNWKGWDRDTDAKLIGLFQNSPHAWGRSLSGNFKRGYISDTFDIDAVNATYILLKIPGRHISEYYDDEVDGIPEIEKVYYDIPGYGEDKYFIYKKYVK